MMLLHLYSCTSDNAEVDKSLTLVTSVNAFLKEPCTMENPSFILEYSPTIKNVNYIYVPDFGRYYFVGARDLLTGGRIVYNCEVDVLSSFKGELRELTAIIGRQEKSFNAYMVDNEYICNNKSIIETRNFSNEFDTDLSIYLAIRGN